jgi:biopolymer transport protein TolR
MAMSTGGGSGVKAEPNVTPMIDVMLVLASRRCRPRGRT